MKRTFTPGILTSLQPHLRALQPHKVTGNLQALRETFFTPRPTSPIKHVPRLWGEGSQGVMLWGSPLAPGRQSPRGYGLFLSLYCALLPTHPHFSLDHWKQQRGSLLSPCPSSLDVCLFLLLSPLHAKHSLQGFPPTEGGEAALPGLLCAPELLAQEVSPLPPAQLLGFCPAPRRGPPLGSLPTS